MARKFPSPLGASYFQITGCIVIDLGGSFVFPSPLGASYFQMHLLMITVRCTILFPSPLGASYFQMADSLTLEYFLSVSVPSRGILFPNGL